MLTSSATVQMLREAVKVSPDNVPLRQTLAEALLSLGKPEEAEHEFRRALERAPEHGEVKLGLAHAFQQQGKNTEALVVIEDVLKGPNRPARAYLLHARLLLAVGAVDQSVRQYRAAVEADPSVADPVLASQLGIQEDAHERHEVVDGRVRTSWDDEAAPLEGELERPKLTFRDVGGMESLKDEIRVKIIHPLTHPDLYKAYGKPIGGGILMYGPPGCGKTYLARATAGEVKATFLAVGINEVLEMWFGRSEQNLHQVFEQARRNKPCVLFFDEVDALAASRADMRSNWTRHLINQFLAELDGVQSSNDGVLILAATNAPWHLDSAFRRPGRFDRILFVPPPDAGARAAILRIQCRDRPVQDIDYDLLARQTDGFSGADLKAVVDTAVERKLRDAVRDGVPTPLTSTDLVAAAGKVRSSTKEWFASARNHALYANQGGLYDEILKYLKL